MTYQETSMDDRAGEKLRQHLIATLDKPNLGCYGCKQPARSHETYRADRDPCYGPYLSMNVRNGDLAAMLAELDRMTAGRDEAQEALGPLVEQLGDWWHRVPDDLDVYTAPAGEHWGLDEAIREGGWKPAYTIGDLRRARRVLDGKEDSR